MKKNKFTKYLIIAALMLAQTAPVTFADSDKSGFKFPTTITTAPIGSAETIGSLEINGRYVGQQGMLWNGDVVSAATGNTAAVSSRIRVTGARRSTSCCRCRAAPIR